MKKNLLYLLAFVCSVTLFSACSSDDDDDSKKNNGNEPGEDAVITAPDVVLGKPEYFHDSGWFRPGDCHS